MTPIFLNSTSTTYSPCPNDFHHEDHLSNQYLSPNSQASSSLNSHTTNMFLNSTVYDKNRIFNRELHSPQHQHEGDILGSQAYNHQTENIDEKGVELFTWNKGTEIMNNMNNDKNQVKWVSSKMRVMLKLKKPDPNLNTYTSTITEETNLEDHKLPTSPVEETDNSSNSTSSNNNIPIRVCSDCYTTKTPLWRSGPRGPKSLCNACGIRQRKARRALAAAAAAENGNSDVSIIMTPLKLKKTQHRDHKNGYVAKYKKRKYSKHIKTTINTPPSSPSPWPSPSASPSSSSPPRKNRVEEFLVSLSKNLSFYRVFPQDEKEAAILLMALSCGFVAHET